MVVPELPVPRPPSVQSSSPVQRFRRLLLRLPPRQAPGQPVRRHQLHLLPHQQGHNVFFIFILLLIIIIIIVEGGEHTFLFFPQFLLSSSSPILLEVAAVVVPAGPLGRCCQQTLTPDIASLIFFFRWIEFTIHSIN